MPSLAWYFPSALLYIKAWLQLMCKPTLLSLQADVQRSAIAMTASDAAAAVAEDERAGLLAALQLQQATLQQLQAAVGTLKVGLGRPLGRGYRALATLRAAIAMHKELHSRPDALRCCPGRHILHAMTA